MVVSDGHQPLMAPDGCWPFVVIDGRWLLKAPDGFWPLVGLSIVGGCRSLGMEAELWAKNGVHRGWDRTHYC